MLLDMHVQIFVFLFSFNSDVSFTVKGLLIVK